MAAKPRKASDSPDQPSAKLWELLRRNTRFINLSKRLTELDRQAQPCAGATEEAQFVARTARERGAGIILCLDRINPFAADALRWLAPQPLFVERQVALGADLKDNPRAAPVSTVRMRWSLSAKSVDLEACPWFEGDPPSNVGGRFPLSAESKAFRDVPRRWGPVVTKITPRSSRLRHLCRDEIAEWRIYFAKHQFTIETPWVAAPPGFRRAFCQHWSKQPGGSDQGQETEFFQDWDLGRTLTQLCQLLMDANRAISDLMHDLDRIREGQAETVFPPRSTVGGGFVRSISQFRTDLDETIQSKAMAFRELSRLRVFAVPRPLTSSDAKAIFKKLGKAVARDLPDSRSLLGTPAFWSDFEAVETIEREEGVDTGEAIRKHISRTKVPTAVKSAPKGGLSAISLRRWFRFRDGELAPKPTTRGRDLEEWKSVHSQVMPIICESHAAHRTTVKGRVAYIRRLIGASFPRLNHEVLTDLPQHKRTRRK